MKIFVQKEFEDSGGFKEFLKDCKTIKDFIKSEGQSIALLNKKGVSSKKIQDLLYEGVIKKLGYLTENKQDFFVPDFLKTGIGYGIMIEVERGKTINNNMDFIDFWKCHISQKSNMLVLIVPEKVPRASDKNMNIYSFVLRRMEPLFQDHNYTNVKALAVISY